MQSLSEIGLLLNKTNSEVEKLANRELQMSNRVRDMKLHLDNFSREDIRDLYTTSHEIQLRLFMMRSQAEQLQNRQQHIKDTRKSFACSSISWECSRMPADETTLTERSAKHDQMINGTEVLAWPTISQHHRSTGGRAAPHLAPNSRRADPSADQSDSARGDLQRLIDRNVDEARTTRQSTHDDQRVAPGDTPDDFRPPPDDP